MYDHTGIGLVRSLQAFSSPNHLSDVRGIGEDNLSMIKIRWDKSRTLPNHLGRVRKQKMVGIGMNAMRMNR